MIRQINSSNYRLLNKQLVWNQGALIDKLKDLATKNNDLAYLELIEQHERKQAASEEIDDVEMEWINQFRTFIIRVYQFLSIH